MKRPVLFALPFAALTTAACSGQPGSESETVVAEQAALTVDTAATYQLVGVQSGKCVEIPNGSSTIGVQFDIATCTTYLTRSRFKLDAQGSGYYHVRNIGNGLCMDVSGAALTNGAAVVQSTCGSATSQQWSFTDSNGAETLTARHSGKALDVSGFGTADGSKVQQWSPTGGTNQLFRLQAIGSAYTWKNVAIGGGGFVTGIVFSPVQSGLAYARTDVGGLYRWDGATSTWTPLTDAFAAAQGNYLGGESIAADPVNANIVYAAAGMYRGNGNGVILRSTDQGNTWAVNNIAVPMGGNEIGRGMGERLAVDPNNNTILYFGSRTAGLWKSINSGTSWAQVTGFPTSGDSGFGLPVVVFDKRGGTSAGSTTIYVAAATKSAGSNLYQSTNGGVSWSLVSGGPSGLMAHHAGIGTDGTLWLAYSNDYGPYNTSGVSLVGQIWKLSGSTWSNVTPPAANWGGMAGGISVDAQNAQHVIVSTLDWYTPDRLLGTTNGGGTWNVIGQPPVSWNTNASTYNANGAQYWFSSGPQVGTGATNWVEAVALDPFSSSHAMYGTGAGIWSSSNVLSATGSSGQGVTWTFYDKGLEETVPLFLGPAVKGAFLGAIGDLGGMRNTNLDAYSTSGEYTNPVQGNVNGLDFAESNTNIVVRVGNSGSAAADVATSSDNGQTWHPASAVVPGYSGPNQMQSVAVSADGARFIVAPYAGHGNPAYTTNNGTTWTTCSGLPSGAMLASDRVTSGTFYATSGSTLYVSTNGGASFSSVNTFSGSGAPRAVFGKAGEVWVASGSGLYRFTASGATKTQIATASAASGIGFGMAASGQAHPALFIIGTVSGQYGFFRSDDGGGASWTRINDNAHQFGWLQGNFIAGDEGVFGRVYLTSAGRGYIYGN
ncbi:MAG: RICIN domain-containing protein [Pseudomonadota bacterium]